MAWMHPEAIEERCRRFTRPDAERWQKPDPERRLSPGELRVEYPDIYERKYGGLPCRTLSPTPSTKLDILRSDESLRLRTLSLLRGAQVQIAMLRHELALRRKAFNPEQPRHPRYSPGGVGGRWSGEAQFAQNRNRNSLSDVKDAWGNPYYCPGGHHEMPKGVYRHWNLRPETRRVFDQATTGPIPDLRIRSTPDGPPHRHGWFGPEGGLHGAYNRAILELGERYLEANTLTPEQLMPEHACKIMEQIRLSEDPRIRDYNYNNRLMQRLRKLRGGD